MTIRRTARDALLAGALLAVSTFASHGARGAADTGPPAEPPKVLRVIAAGGVPFVVDDVNGTSGLSVEVWRAIAERARLDYVISRASSVDAALEQLRNGRADMAIGPISVTAERSRQVHFTQPYFYAGLSILSRRELRPSQLLAPLLSPTFATGVTFLLCVLTLVGTLVWLAERRRNTDAFPRAAGRGIGNGIWFALVTMTTVGYGDQVPRSALGRTVAAIWMLIAVLSLSSLTAGIASSLTLAKLETGSVQRLDQLRSRHVGAVTGSFGARFVRGLGALVIETPDLDAAIESLIEGRSSAVVHDRPILEYYLREHPELRLTVSPQSYRTTGYALASARGSALNDLVNSALLELTEEERIADISERWLGSP